MHTEDEEEDEELVVDTDGIPPVNHGRSATSVVVTVIIHTTAQLPMITKWEMESVDEEMKMDHISTVHPEQVIAVVPDLEVEVAVVEDGMVVEEVSEEEAAEEEVDQMTRCINWRKRVDESLERSWKAMNTRKMEIQSLRIFIKGCHYCAHGNPSRHKDGI
jgi:ABC-type dipeptide/oligopeptide/nickel transport system ATPase component